MAIILKIIKMVRDIFQVTPKISNDILHFCCLMNVEDLQVDTITTTLGNFLDSAYAVRSEIYYTSLST